MTKKIFETYQPEKKKAYLDLHPNYANYFDNLGGFEREINIDALDFTESIWESGFKYLAQNTKLFTSDKKTFSVISGFKGYLKFNGLIKQSKGLKKIAERVDLFNDSLDYKIDRISTREAFLSNIILKIDAKDVRDAGILLCMFDGIRGYEIIELRSMLDKEDYFNENKVIILTDGVEQKVSVTSETIKYLKNANRQTSLRGVLNKTGFMFRASGEDKTGMMPYNTFKTSLNKIRAKIDNKDFSPNDATLSGIINCLLYAEYLYEKPFVEDIIFLKKVQKRFRNNVKAYYDTSCVYKDYKKANASKDLIIKDFVDEMKTIIDEISKMHLTDEELAFKRGVAKQNEKGHGFEEGRIQYNFHWNKERKPALIREAKENWLKTHEYLQCEVCEMIPFLKYGKAGNTAIEGHHEKPIKDITKKTVFYARDIRLLCSDCHSVIHHNRKKCMTIKELINLLKKI